MRAVVGVRMEAQIESRLFTYAQAASYLNVSPWTIRGLVWDGAVPFVRLGRRHMIDKTDLDKAIDAMKTREGTDGKGQSRGHCKTR